MHNPMLRVTEIFRSIQGESTHAGRPCTFVRLTGCPMRCVWCDSEYPFTGGEHYSIDSILDQVRAFGCKLVEVTGGEPLAQRKAFTLIERLCDEDYEVLIETGGYVSTAGLDPRAKVILDIKCPASGEEPRNDWSNIERLRADESDRKIRSGESNRCGADLAGVGVDRFTATGELDRRQWSESAYAVATAQVYLGSGS
jgi:7-carboxy-7-deazaguanine synthase